MAADRVDRIIADYRRGALTDAAAYLEVLLAAGEGDAEALLARLTPELRELVSRSVAGANPGDVWIVESYAAPPLPKNTPPTCAAGKRPRGVVSSRCND